MKSFKPLPLFLAAPCSLLSALVALCSLLPALLFSQMEWFCAIPSAEWSRRGSHTSVVFDNKIWVLGGEDSTGTSNDIWYSTDGVNWTCATGTARWTARHGHASVVFDSKFWVLGGVDSSSWRNDVWFSNDGVNWIVATDSADWSERMLHTSVTFNDKIWILGGYDGSLRNDVWYSSGLDIEEECLPFTTNHLSLEIYPNPVKSFLAFRFPLTANRSQIKIFDVSGKMIKGIKILRSAHNDRSEGVTRNDEVKVSLKGMNLGIYFLRLGKETKKFLVIK